MTLSDPLLKELKGHVAKLVLESCPPFGDENESVFLLCHCIEAIFIKGLIRNEGFTPWRADTFSWFYQLVRKHHRIIPLGFKLAFDEVLSDTKTKSQTGKTRLLIRSCLKRKCLHVPVQIHVENIDFGTNRINYSNGSIMGHEILSQIFLSLLQQLSQYEFNFDLNNSSFLDDSWQIPKVIKVEFVPCEKLGVTLAFPCGFATVVHIIDHSLASEKTSQICVGDIMDEFNSIPLRNFYGSKIESLFKKHKSKPFKLTFIKANDDRGQLYLPAIKLYRMLGLDPEQMYTKTRENSNEFDPSCHDKVSTSMVDNPTKDLLQDEFENVANGVGKSGEGSSKTVMEEVSLMEDVSIDSANVDTLVDIDLNPQLEINWDSLISTHYYDANNSEPSKENGALISKSSETNDRPHNEQRRENNSVFQSKYVDDTNPFVV